MPFVTRFFASQFKTLPSLPKVDLAGKTIVVTGANSGIGLEICHHLAKCSPSKLILAVRDTGRGDKAREDILSHAKGQIDIAVWQLDMASYDSVRSFAKRCDALERLDAVAMNAGTYCDKPFRATGDGNEITIQVNVLSQILLLLRLAPILQRTRKIGDAFTPRVVFTGSVVTELANTKGLNTDHPLSHLNDKTQFVMADRYFQSKLILQVVMNRILTAFPDLVIVNAFPGYVNAPSFYKDSGAAEKMSVRMFGRSPEVGARNVSMALLTAKQSHKSYNDCAPYEVHQNWLRSKAGVEFEQNFWKDCRAEFGAEMEAVPK